MMNIPFRVARGPGISNDVLSNDEHIFSGLPEVLGPALDHALPPSLLDLQRVVLALLPVSLRVPGLVEPLPRFLNEEKILRCTKCLKKNSAIFLISILSSCTNVV